MTKVTASSTFISDVVGFSLEISVELASNKRASRSHVPDVQGLRREVEMFEVAQNVSCGLIQVIIQMLAAVVVIVFGCEALSIIAGLS